MARIRSKEYAAVSSQGVHWDTNYNKEDNNVS